MKKRSTKAVVDVEPRSVPDDPALVEIHQVIVDTFATVNPLPTLQDVVNMLPVDVGPAADLVRDAVDARFLAAAEATGLHVTHATRDGTGFIVTCGPHVPPFRGATVAEVVAAIGAYNCKYCGSGGGHNPNCGRPRT